MGQHLEVETKFSVSESTQIPQLEAIAEVDHIDRTEIHQLSAVYFDTVDLRLTRAKITLRRRTGGNDAGWHIKFPEPSVAVKSKPHLMAKAQQKPSLHVSSWDTSER